MPTLLERIAAMRADVVELQRRLVAIPALGPDNDGPGEKAKADWLEDHLRSLGFGDPSMPLIRIEAPDPRVPSGSRPSLAAKIPGQDKDRTLWIIAHTDVVPPGDLGLWDADPYSLRVEGDHLYGRGVEDNHQGLVSALLLAKALIQAEAEDGPEAPFPPIGLGLLLVADEETGSRYGLDYVLANEDAMFGKNDLFLVPDFGAADSSQVEVAEKSMCWTRFTVSGKQCHASTPGQGVNSLVAAADLILRLNGLNDPEGPFGGRDDLFDPPFSTFAPTKKEANVPNVNTIPGRDVFYVDARILPHYRVDDVLQAMEDMCRQVEAAFGVKAALEVVQRADAAPPTPADADIVTRLIAGVAQVYGVQARPVGIGGGTVAAFLRRRGYQAAVWGTLEHYAHQPNERSSITATVKDAQVMAHALFNGPA